MNKLKEINFICLILIISISFKIPLLLIEHIQEDSFITWRVSKNLLEYGIIGFNGEEKISASTTHFYVLISTIFQYFFGNNFIIPLLLFSSILFTLGTILISKILFTNLKQKESILLLIFSNIIPPALACSVLGMEYGILFFLFCSMLYFGIYLEKKWAIFFFCILIIWTRIDTVIFLGITFLISSIFHKKINYSFIIAGIIGLLSVVVFNFIYFNEIINHTITSKKIAYPKEYSFNYLFFINQLSYYGGFIKKVSTITNISFLIFIILATLALKHSLKKSINKNKQIILTILFSYPIIKILIFVYLRAYFDWYYWIPREFLSILIIYYLLKISENTKLKITILSIIFLGFYSFQVLQSSAIAYMENNQRKKIADYLIVQNITNQNTIYLEPAGKIPFYTNLKTYDEVGLVNYEVTEEMKKDFPNYWMNFIEKYNPDYILVIGQKPNLKNKKYFKTVQDSIYYEKNYKLTKEYPINEIHNIAPPYIKFIYNIRPIGQNYYLYQKK